jgi:nucleotide-binding universal stress UspA family protein
MVEICPTTRVEKILLSTDGSEYSEGAIREAIKLAKKCSSKLTVLSVIDTNPEFDALAPQLMEKKEKEARQNLDTLQTRARQEGVDCDTIVHEGEEPYKYIVDEAIKSKSTMIVMGRRGRTGLKRLMMGSVTARVISHAPAMCSWCRRLRSSNSRTLWSRRTARNTRLPPSEALGLAKWNGAR